MIRDNGDINFLRKRLKELIKKEEYEKCVEIKNWISELSRLKIETQFCYVKNVVNSCLTEEQTLISHKWAKDWAKRIASNFPEKIKDYLNLFEEVIKPDCECQIKKETTNKELECPCIQKLFKNV